MTTLTKTCKNCGKQFKADIREHNRGNANFCSISCGSSNRDNPQIIDKICKHCSRNYKSVLESSKYCSNSCKLKNYRFKKKSGVPYEKRLEQEIQKYPCEICNWAESSRDVHHIIPVSKGGKSEITNLISLCPNHHRLADKELLSQLYLKEVIKLRTISSSLEDLLSLIALSKEQDAYSGY